ncbi:hypothetical protein GZ77_05180 [Endozoicomonas montiporae]|uniref:Uncharacterized protein n=2 Tax=Endozoicomonas montiporae TaxID=1027273 RepID=A0A081NBT1_9GAMM|nr:hypothetical protein [Endozoicomonas montiporae]AMO56208.1 hypothetical protein EZMO1_2089 [Endozoicomonas montiporae CL-33]KEQ15904.1 hypothetical protein GZ77_05180 [Endozoicomonas montiporae]
MSTGSQQKLVWWDIAKFRETGARKLPLFHGLVYLIIALLTWALVFFLFLVPKLLKGEFGDSLATGFFITLFGFIIFAYGYLSETYDLIKKNNLKRYPVIWLGCWSVSGFRSIILFVIPAYFIVAPIYQQYPYNAEDLLLIVHGALFLGLYLSQRKIKQTFFLEEESNNEKEDQPSKEDNNA